MNAFRFGHSYIDHVYVSPWGAFLVGEIYNIPVDVPGFIKAVAPYSYYIDRGAHGTVFYQTFESPDPELDRVSAFVESQTRVLPFNGTSMIVGEWNQIHVGLFTSALTNTFQGIIITNETTSFAVFIYECGGMDWSGADIGWVGSFYLYEKHPYGKTAYSKDMGCRYSTTYSAIVYRLDRECTPFEFPCGNGYCKSIGDVCNGNNDC
jgi:hypothetical protein